MAKAGKPAPISKKEFEDALARVLRRAEKLRAVINGDAGVIAVWRAGYKEKKVREVRGHWMHVITTRQPKRAVKRRKVYYFKKGA